MSTASRKFQAPKGTRDFYPQDMAVRRYIEGVWRQTSINHGFDEVEGPMFEDIELYKHKSGPGIVSEIFQVYSGKDEKEIAAIRGGQDAPFALRPEFTPTLARMVAAKAAELPRPIKWFAIPQHFRAERPQRGRLREFMQWNVDYLGGDSNPKADGEVISIAIAAFEKFRIAPPDVVVAYSHREYVRDILSSTYGIRDTNVEAMFALFDEAPKIQPEEFDRRAIALGIAEDKVNWFSTFAGVRPLEGLDRWSSYSPWQEAFKEITDDLDISHWCDFRPSIVRGLAYYTGTVFEIHETTGAERAIAGGGRYDNLIESFGGPSLPACGFGMGDVVLANLLHDKGLLPEEVYMKPLRPHAFAIALDDEAEKIMRQTVAQLRRNGFHIRHSYKTTRNVGKLLGDASKSRAMSAIIFGKDVAAGRVDFKDLILGKQDDEPLSIDTIESRLKQVIETNQ